MSTTLVSNPKRVMQMLWLAAGVLFTIAVIRSLQSTGSADWVSKGVVKFMGDNTRSSLKEHMKLAEASWAKTVKQRHDMIQTDYGSVDKMPL